jgi:hypothetical protein
MEVISRVWFQLTVEIVNLKRPLVCRKVHRIVELLSPAQDSHFLALWRPIDWWVSFNCILSTVPNRDWFIRAVSFSSFVVVLFIRNPFPSLRAWIPTQFWVNDPIKYPIDTVNPWQPNLAHFNLKCTIFHFNFSSIKCGQSSFKRHLVVVFQSVLVICYFFRLWVRLEFYFCRVVVFNALGNLYE